MTDPERDEAAERIFAGAMVRGTGAERVAYLDGACAGDAELRRWVEALLAADAAAGGFLERPPLGLAGTNADLNGAPLEHAAEEVPGTVIGRYKLLERIGEGGMGVVFMAQQQHPVRRRVAVKVIRAGMDSRQVVARFEAERQALALMDHPSIAKVLDGGTTVSGRPYFVMELVQGIPITDFCDRNKLPARQRLELFVPVCQAVQHAHNKGLIHRDLKPGNVLVTLADGVPVPKVIDFGIAKAAGQELTERTLFTQFAQMVGTPLYMSPEQAGGGADVDTRSDVYSLGVLLYELLTGTTPFDKRRLGAAGFDEVRRIIRDEDPPKPSTRISTLGVESATVSERRGTEPRRLRQLVRGELDWIVMRALEKDRNRRYESASALALDVQRHLDGEVVHACPPSVAYRFRKYARRHRVVLSTGGAIAAMLILATAVSSWQAVRARTAARVARLAAAELALDKGQLLGESGDPNLALLWLTRALKLAPPDAGDLQAAIRLGMGSWTGRVDAVRWAAPHEGVVASVAFGRGGKLITASGLPNSPTITVEWWDPASGHCEATKTFSVDGLNCVELDRDGGQLLLGSFDGLLRLEDLSSGLRLWETRTDAGVARCAAFSPDSRCFVIGYETGPSGAHRQGGRAQIYDSSTGRPRGPPLVHARPVVAFAFHPDGTQFATESGTWGDAAEPAAARFFDLDGRETREPLSHPCLAPAVAFSPDGTKLLTGHWDRVARLWDLTVRTGGREVGGTPVVLQHEGPVVTAAFSPDGRRLATGSFDGSVRLWDIYGRSLGPPLRQGHMVQAMALSSDGAKVLVGNHGGVARLWELAREGRTATSLRRPPVAFPLAISPDARTILTQAGDHSVRLRDAATNEAIGMPLPHHRPLLVGGTSILPGQRSACSSDRRRAITIDQDTVASLWDVESGRLIAELKVDPEWSTFFAAAFSPDGKIVVTGNFMATACVWDAETGKLLRTVEHNAGGTVFNINFSPDGRTLVTGAADCTVRFWNPDTGAQLGEPLTHHTPVFAVALSPDGRRAVTGDVDRNVQLWDVASRRRLLNLTGHQGGIHDAAFSADGRFVVTGSRDHTARLWDAATGKPIGPPMTHTGPVVRVAFGRDGRTIRTALQDQTAHEWPVPAPVAGTPDQLERWAEVTTGMRIAADGGVQIPGAVEWEQLRRQTSEEGPAGVGPGD